MQRDRTRPHAALFAIEYERCGILCSRSRAARTGRGHTVDGRELLILSGESRKTGQDDDTEGHYDALERYARERFAVRSVEYRWSTEDHMTVDQVPYIGKLRRGSDRLFTATGFNKWG